MMGSREVSGREEEERGADQKKLIDCIKDGRVAELELAIDMAFEIHSLILYKLKR